MGIGDHQAIIVDIPQSSFLGDALKKISRPAGRRLQCNNDTIMNKYDLLLETYCRSHRIQHKLYEVMKVSKSHLLQLQMDTIDKVLGEEMRYAKKMSKT